MKKILSLIFILWGCNISGDQDPPISLSPDEINRISAVSQDYVNAWLQDDTLGVLDLFADTATIIPSGMSPKRGKAAMRAFWFPNDSSVTVIHEYEVNILEVAGQAGMAYTLEEGHLSFSYEKGDFQMSRESHAFATTVLKKSKDGDWKIVQRMWTDQR